MLVDSCFTFDVNTENFSEVMQKDFLQVEDKEKTVFSHKCITYLNIRI